MEFVLGRFLHCNCLFKLYILWCLNSKFLWVHLKTVNILAKRAHPWSQHFGSLTEYTNRLWIILILFYVDAQPPYVSTVTWNEQYAKPILFQLLIFTARKQSLRQGNMFTGVCLSTGGVPVPGGAWSQGGCLVPGGGPAAGRSDPGGVPGGDPPDGYCWGRYASYWNTFFCHHDNNNVSKFAHDLSCSEWIVIGQWLVFLSCRSAHWDHSTRGSWFISLHAELLLHVINIHNMPKHLHSIGFAKWNFQD